MSKARVIGSHVKLALDDLLSVKTLGFSDRNSVMLLFYAAENLLMAVLTSEDTDVGSLRRKIGNHQLDRMIDELPHTCSVKRDFVQVSELTAYATTYRYPTPGGRIPVSPAQDDVGKWYRDLIGIVNSCTHHFRINPNDAEPVAGYDGPFR